MTVANALSQIRLFARAKSSAISDANLLTYLNEGIRNYANDTHNLVKDAYLTVAPRFNLSPTLAIRLTITGGTNALAATDIAICTTAANAQTGTQVATALQAAIRAAGPTTLTVAWSTTTWKFTISAVDSTAIKIEAPTGITYGDGLWLLGFEDGDSGVTGITGDMPTDCNVDVTLPSDFVNLVTDPEWDRNPIYPGTADLFETPQTFGEPNYYHINNKTLRLYPVPSSQKPLHIRYHFLPTAFTVINGYQECGLTGKHATTATGLAASTQYYFKVTVNEGAQEELSITTATDRSYAAVIALINAALAASSTSTGCSAALTGGDLRFTSSSAGVDSAIALAAGTTGTNLFATLTGWSAFDTAVAGQGSSSLELEEEDCMAPVYYAAFMCLQASFEPSEAREKYALYQRMVQTRNAKEMCKNPKIGFQNAQSNILNHEIVTMADI